MLIGKSLQLSPKIEDPRYPIYKIQLPSDYYLKLRWDFQSELENFRWTKCSLVNLIDNQL